MGLISGEVRPCFSKLLGFINFSRFPVENTNCNLSWLMHFDLNSRCTCISWVPGGDGAFVVAHADGNLYVYEKARLKLALWTYFDLFYGEVSS